jgi:hypothetical protein
MRNINTIPETNPVTWSEVTPEAPDWRFRFCIRKGVKTLSRKTHHPALYGGHKIEFVPLNTRLAREWLEIAGYDIVDLCVSS